MFTTDNLPNSIGLSLKPQHFHHILEHHPPIGFFEIHPENYMSEGGAHLDFLERVCERYPISMHGVGMSLGSSSGINDKHLSALKSLADRFQPAQISEHVSWSRWHDLFINDLLPLPYTRESLQIICKNIDHVQGVLGRTILIENPSAYIDFRNQEYSEPEFLTEVCNRTDCGLLLDVNNIVVSAYNQNFKIDDYLNNLPYSRIGEIHLAGHSEKPLKASKTIKIDDHGSVVSEEVWHYFDKLLTQIGQAKPSLIEWDTDIPEFEVFEEQANRAGDILNRHLANLKATQLC